jgi:hypothetical protein
MRKTRRENEGIGQRNMGRGSGKKGITKNTRIGEEVLLQQKCGLRQRLLTDCLNSKK